MNAAMTDGSRQTLQVTYYLQQHMTPVGHSGVLKLLINQYEVVRVINQYLQTQFVKFFFIDRVVNVWNFVPSTVSFNFVSTFESLLNSVCFCLSKVYIKCNFAFILL